MTLDEALEQYDYAERNELPVPRSVARVLAAEVRRLQKPSTCLWWETGEMWESSCGVAWQFMDGGPKENDCTYCNKCGAKIEVVEELEKQK